MGPGAKVNRNCMTRGGMATVPSTAVGLRVMYFVFEEARHPALFRNPISTSL